MQWWRLLAVQSGGHFSFRSRRKECDLFREDQLEAVKFEGYTWGGERISEVGQKFLAKGRMSYKACMPLASWTVAVRAILMWLGMSIWGVMRRLSTRRVMIKSKI